MDNSVNPAGGSAGASAAAPAEVDGKVEAGSGAAPRAKLAQAVEQITNKNKLDNGSVTIPWSPAEYKERFEAGCQILVRLLPLAGEDLVLELMTQPVAHALNHKDVASDTDMDAKAGEVLDVLTERFPDEGPKSKLVDDFYEGGSFRPSLFDPVTNLRLQSN